MKHRLFFVLAALGLLCACRDAVRTEGTAQEGVSLDSLWKRCVDLRVGAEGSRVDVSDCVRGVPMPILVDSTPFAAADYSFVRVNAVTGYELCRYGEHALLEIEQGGCEYFGVTFRWSYNAVGEEVSDRQLVRRALLDTRGGIAGRWVKMWSGVRIRSWRYGRPGAMCRVRRWISVRRRMIFTTRCV